ncbi:MAG: MBL fold metallo-hydrolase [Anaerolineae bacterium]|nr:MBL fold metallo-hydrolase [Anaerolineae bacterium]
MIGDAYQLEDDDFHVTILCDADQNRDPRTLFTSVLPEALERAAQSENFQIDAVPFSMNILLIQTPQHKVLVDTGLGSGTLLKTLEQIGVRPESIDRVIITHGHGDHIGGIMGENGLNFPNARYTFWKSEWDYWFTEAQKGDETHPARRNLFPIQDRVDFIDTESEILPGVSAVSAPGHTLGQMGLLIEHGVLRLLHIADAAHTHFQVVHPDWSPRFDMQPDVSAKTRKALFERAADQNLLLTAYHFPFPGLGRISRDGENLKWTSV